jgi:RNA polymerase sigma-70 factor (ECF subfamily)
LVGDQSSARGKLRGELSDAQLVLLVQGGDGHAFESLYRRHVPFAINLAVRIQGNAGDVEDVAHDAFIRALHRIHELRDSQRFRAWLGSIVVHLVRTRLRRRRLLGALGLGAAQSLDLDSLASTEATPEQRAQIAQVYALLSTLAPDDRIAWTLRYVEHNPLEQVAELCGCSLATAKRRIVRVQKFLSDHFISTELEAEAKDHVH